MLRHQTQPIRPAGGPVSILNQDRPSITFGYKTAAVNRPILSLWSNLGYAALTEGMPSQSRFDAFYALADQLFDSSDATTGWQTDAAREAAAWSSAPGNSAAYAGAPVAFRDRRPRDDKGEKIYFQFCNEYYFYLKSNRSSIYYRNALFAHFCDILFDFAWVAEQIFVSALTELDGLNGNLTRLLRGDAATFSILLKTLTYYPHTDWATDPHFDKSALSLVMNADDLESDSFRIAPYKANILECELQPPNRKRGYREPAVALLFPGMMLHALGFDGIAPSPHGVAPLKSDRRRHSLIAFLIAPKIDTSRMQTGQFSSLEKAYG